MLTFETAAKTFFRRQTVCAKFYIGTGLINLELARDLEHVFEPRPISNQLHRNWSGPEYDCIGRCGKLTRLA
jgi:hypothetical protein